MSDEAGVRQSDVAPDELAYHTGLVRWRAAAPRAAAPRAEAPRTAPSMGGFGHWDLAGVRLDDSGSLALDLPGARPERDPYPPGGYRGHSFYNGGTFLVGEATSPVTPAGFGFHQAIASWNAMTPPGTWIETLLRAQTDDHWTAWYSLGVWATDAATVQRHSVEGQRDADGAVAVDTLQLNSRRAPAAALQVRLRLFSASEAPGPLVSGAAVALSDVPGAGGRSGTLAEGNPALWDHQLAIPACSQMVYPDGGEVWCSPTSVAMVLRYWQSDARPCEPRVREVVAGVYDWVYRGHGNWPFNTAYAATQGLESCVVRLRGLADAEGWIAAGVPLILSYGWKRGELTGAPLASSNGHLVVLSGFDRAGTPVVDDPAAPSNRSVRRTYPRAQLEDLWMAHSGGTAYVITPIGH
ncbi:MAG: C39 family peptidase [Chloroflexota bacterium]|nr:C39 family peptidase [Chloroflexota bacterium]